MARFINEDGKEREDVFHENSLVRDFNVTIEISDYHVFGLIGKWGSGKTTFVNFWEDYVKTEKNDEYSIIHVDAFSKDYIEDPFSMLFAAFKAFMRENKVSSEEAKPFVEKARQAKFSVD